MLQASTRTLGSWFVLAQARLDDIDAQYLCEAAFNVDLATLVAQADTTVSDDDVETLKRYIQRRLKGEPTAYILGTRGFWRGEFIVSPATLIPRPETETLVETVLPTLANTSDVLDLGAGSGVIGLSLAVETGASILLSDVSLDALRVAEQNAKQLKINVRLRQSNWYDNITESFDCIVANPPYVASTDPHLQAGDLRFEPKLALDGGLDGLDAVKVVVSKAPEHLHPEGRLAVEHGFDQADAVRGLFATTGFECVKLVRDLNGHPRVTHGVLA